MGKGKHFGKKRSSLRASSLMPLRQAPVDKQAEFAYSLACASFEVGINQPRIAAHKAEGIASSYCVSSLASAEKALERLKKHVRVRTYDESRFSMDDIHATYMYKLARQTISKDIEKITWVFSAWDKGEKYRDDNADKNNSEKGFADFCEEVISPDWINDKEQLITRCAEAICAAFSAIFSRAAISNSMPYSMLKRYCDVDSDLTAIAKSCIFYTGGRFSAKLAAFAVYIVGCISDSWLFNLASSAAIHKAVFTSSEPNMHLVQFSRALLGLITVALCDESLCKKLFFDGFCIFTQLSGDRDGLVMSHSQFDFLQLYGTKDHEITALKSDSVTVYTLIRNDSDYVKALKKPYSNFFGYKHNFSITPFVAPAYGYENDDYKNMTSSALDDVETFAENFDNITYPYTDLHLESLPELDEDDPDNADALISTLMMLGLNKNKPAVSFEVLTEKINLTTDMLATEGRALGTSMFMDSLNEYQRKMRLNCGAGYTLDAINTLSDKHTRASNTVNKLTDTNSELGERIKQLEAQLADYRRKGASDDALKKIAALEKKVTELGTQNAKYKSRLANLTDQQNKIHTLEQKYNKSEAELLEARRQIDFMQTAEDAIVENESALSEWEITQLATLKVHLVVPDLMSYKDLAKYMPKSEFKFVPNDRYVRLPIGTGYDIYFMSTKMTCHGYWWQWLKDLKAVPHRRIGAYTVGKNTTARLILAKAMELGLISSGDSGPDANSLAGAISKALK